MINGEVRGYVPQYDIILMKQSRIEIVNDKKV